jgi:alkylation response protein AidB-like acyl-CoA dehydrogenase
MDQEFNTILTKVRRFIEEEIIPLEKGSFISTWPEMKETLEAKRTKVKALGLWTPQIPKEWGGLGLTLAQFGQVSEILGLSPYGHYVFNCQAPDSGNMEILIEHGTPEQQEQFLKPLLKGEIRSCFSMTEPEFAGSNPVMMGTTGVKEGSDYNINGHKWFTSSADGAAFAIVMCITNPDAENRYERASQIIVPTDTEGFEFIRNISIMGEAGSDWPSHAEIKYNNCRVPQSNLLGKEGGGFAIAQNRLGPGRIHHCMRWIGICERAFDMMCKRAMSREIAPGKPLATKQTIQNWIAESRAEINGSRLMVMDAAHKIDTVGTYKARIEISIIKFHVANVLQRVLDRAIQVHGALGITDDTPLATWFAHERGARIYDGPDEAHKSRVARQILKGY